ncbi:class I SAM-dependent rRNA methyltransferase [Tissierella creatinophila]|uniref:Ribosomal RNA large subunit methyltransferase I n=1 Tax=Tissierella creatinophila DSM 6911 TaxID=1123403 RepID=A0A1U7M604_TISCR|nr:class I SAM-dependent rRNA methyltransferase [Tissierella creatinophila]OLS02618.1 ribosomal RNA large subunit methyltransferase I [Tissierella creatinophila DSM 6911]
MIEKVNLKIKPKFIEKYKDGYPLIFKESISNIYELKEEGTIVDLVDDRDEFIARGYYGKQNKGYGWVLTQKEDESIDLSFFIKRFIVALNKRTKFFNDPDTNCFRVFNGEGDGVGGLTVEYFDGYFVINWYSRGIYEFRDFVIEALKSVTSFKGIYEKKRFDEDGKYIDQDDFITGERAPIPLIVKENGVNFAIYLNEGAMVGVFLDQREVRKTIRDKYSKGKKVLNTFSYTGAFSIFASLGGAKTTTSVDLANRSLPKTSEHFKINGIDPEKEEIIVEDVFKYFKYAVKKELKFDLCILDPPSFAKSKNFIFSADKDYKDLLKQVIEITQAGGVIVASTNCANFNRNKFKSFVSDAFKELGLGYKILEEFSLPEDFKTIDSFKEGDYLKVLFIKRQN